MGIMSGRNRSKMSKLYNEISLSTVFRTDKSIKPVVIDNDFSLFTGKIPFLLKTFFSKLICYSYGKLVF
jgi:hypothetical protein